MAFMGVLAVIIGRGQGTYLLARKRNPELEAGWPHETVTHEILHSVEHPVPQLRQRTVS